MQTRIDFQDQISRNKTKSFFLMALILIVIVALGYCVSFAFDKSYFFTIMIFSIVVSIFYVVFSFYNSDKIAVMSVGAISAKREEYKEYYSLVEGLTIASGMPMPKLYIMQSNNINAFASGRDPNHAVVCVTNGALEKLEKRELEGVLAHELGHVASYDMRYMTIVAVMVGMVAIISEIFLRSMSMKNSNDRDSKGGAVIMLIGLLLAILAPIVVQLVQLGISRKREFVADASAVKFTRYPSGLINALKKIKSENFIPEKKVSKAIAPLFFSSPLSNLFSTHPALEKRISVLESM